MWLTWAEIIRHLDCCAPNQTRSVLCAHIEQGCIHQHNSVMLCPLWSIPCAQLRTQLCWENELKETRRGEERNLEDKATADGVKRVFHSRKACGMKTADLEGNAYYYIVMHDENPERREERLKQAKRNVLLILKHEIWHELWGKGLQLRVRWGYRTQGWENGNKQGCDQHERQKKEWARDVEKMKQSKRNSFISCSMDHSIFYIHALQIFKTDS